MDRIIYSIEESIVNGSCQAYCPELIITAFGDTSDEAKESLRRDCRFYTTDAAEEGLGVDLGGRRILKKKTDHSKSQYISLSTTLHDSSQMFIYCTLITS